MLILSIDTSGKNGSVALARGDADNFELIAASPVEGGTFSAQLIPQIARLLSENNL
jgi:tRNA A37 threonylcarbamoyladenosine modification protein TsaB